MQPLLVMCLVAAATCLPFHNGPSEGTVFSGLRSEDYSFLRTLPAGKVAREIAGFHYIFVDNKGNVSNTRGAAGTTIEIAGSPRTSQRALIAAADYVAKMTKYMPSSIFRQVAISASVGIFTAAEKLTVFPEYANLASGSCGRSCAGSCSRTCTFDGRKYEDIAGAGGQRGVVLDDNVLCTPQDPYYHNQNILSHEFAHTIHGYGLTDAIKRQINEAYQAAKVKGTWVPTEYAMADANEYFAVGTTVYFFVNKNNETTGAGMNNCGSRLCNTEQEARAHLRNNDRLLYNILTNVFTNNRFQLPSYLTICPPGSIAG